MDLPVSVVDDNHSPVSRQIIRDLNAGPHDVKTIDDNLSTSLKRLGSSKDYALLYIPHNFEEDVLRGRQPELRMYYMRSFMHQAVMRFKILVASGRAECEVSPRNG